MRVKWHSRNNTSLPTSVPVNFEPQATQLVFITESFSATQAYTWGKEDFKFTNVLSKFFLKQLCLHRFLQLSLLQFYPQLQFPGNLFFAEFYPIGSVHDTFDHFFLPMITCDLDTTAICAIQHESFFLFILSKHIVKVYGSHCWLDER